jgi:hypothetical protein
MSRKLTDEEFGDLLKSFRETAFYLETQDHYALDYEMDDFSRFLAGQPEPPSEISWWRLWLDQIASLTREGKRVTRTRITADPPSDYQRWGLWALPWHTQAGERIIYLTRSKAREIGLPGQYDWWLLDNSKVIILKYDTDGRCTSKTVHDDPETVEQHRKWRDLAVRNAIPAAQVRAA